MIKGLKKTVYLVSILLLVSGCAQPVQQEEEMKYPRKPADNPERKSGPAMLFYEAAEEDADVNNVIVTPPPGKKPVSVSP